MPSPPVDPALEERVARAVWRDPTHEERFLVSRALAALTPEDLLALLSARSDEVDKDPTPRRARPAQQAIPQARSDEVVVSFTRREIGALAAAGDEAPWIAWDKPLVESLSSARSKLSTALESE